MKKKNLLYPLFLILLSGCSNCLSEYIYSPPENPETGLPLGRLEEVNLDPRPLSRAVDEIRCGSFGAVHSLLIYRHGKLVMEEYFPGYEYQWDAPGYVGQPVSWDRNMIHHSMSCTKSVTSACIAIAVEKGFIDNVHQSIFDYLPQHQQFRADGKENITIEHLLTMSSGLAWNEWNAPHGTAANDIDRLYFECSGDPLACVLERPLEHPPGEYFTYNGGGIISLGEILRNASGMDIIAFAEQYLFKPLGIDTFRWDRFPKAEVECAGGLSLRPRDMLKFGVMYLQGGTWLGEQIVPAEWVKKSSAAYGNNKNIRLPIEDSGKNGYGYTWWTTEPGKGKDRTSMYRANGWGGQVIMVFPELDMVVVFTGGNYAARSKLFRLTERFILPSVS